MTRTVGRPHIDGSAAGTAPRLDRVTITISAEDAEYLRSMGNGNLSAGIRQVCRLYRLVKEWQMVPRTPLPQP